MLLPDAITPAWEEVFKGVKEGTIPSVLIEKGLIFINGVMVLPREFPAWLGHEAIDIPSAGRDEDITVEVEETRFWMEIILESDNTVTITVPFQTSVYCREVFMTQSSLDKHMLIAHNDTFERYKSALCTKTYVRYKQAAVHHA